MNALDEQRTGTSVWGLGKGSDAETDGAGQREDDSGETSVPPSQPKLILADDNKLLRRGLAKLLRYHGYQVLEARDGLETLQHLRDHGESVCVVVSDVVMPVLGGRETIEKIRPDFPDLPVILMSGYGEGLEQFVAEHEHVYLLTKPFDNEQLVRAITAAQAPVRS